LNRKRRHGPIVKETVFESLALQLVMVPIPIAPETEVVLVPGGSNTSTSTIPGSPAASCGRAEKRAWLRRIGRI
jgi:hypothetical protein